MTDERREPAPFRIGIVADDLTGALDAGAGFAKAGMRVRVPLGPVGTPLDVSGADAIVINTASREGSAEDAHARTRAATIALLRSGDSIPASSGPGCPRSTLSTFLYSRVTPLRRRESVAARASAWASSAVPSRDAVLMTMTSASAIA